MYAKSIPFYDKRAQIYQSLHELSGFVLFMSADTIQGNYDILSACPYDTFQSAIPLDDGGLVDKLDITYPKTCYPFIGGAIGYVSYEWGASGPFVQDVNDKYPLLKFNFYDWALIACHKTQTLTMVSLLKKTDTLDTLQRIENIIAEAVLIDTEIKACNPPKSTALKSLMSYEAYQHAFNAIQKDLRKGRCYQINLTKRYTAECGSHWELFTRLMKKNPAPFAGFMRINDETSIISCSPERLLAHRDGQLITSPIKGTIKRSSDPIEDEKLKHQLQHSLKDSAENVMIVDLLRNDLGKIAVSGSVKVTALQALQSFASVHHLVSTIKAQLKSTLHPWDAFKALFPGGSITGAPKIEALKCIAELENTARGIYCGALMYLSYDGGMDSNIAIRTLLCQGNQCWMGVGGGIVLDSLLDSEYEECEVKLKAIRNVFESDDA